MDARLLALLISLTLPGGVGGCGKKKTEESVTEAPAVKPPGEPPEDMPEEEWAQWEQRIEARERERANRPPPQVQVQWPAAVETDLADFNGWWIRLKGRVEFGPDHRSVAPEAMDVLDDVAFILTETPRIKKVEIQAHRHNRMDTAGQNITQLRADAVKAYLVEHGVEAERLEARGYEDTMPIETNTSDLGRRANTRVELIVRQIDEHAVNTDL